MLDVYLDPCTINCRKVLAGLQLMDIPYNEKYINYFKAEQKSPEYLKINPNATIPAATDGPGCTITESNAILMYAADSNNKAAFYPTDLKARANANAWLLWEASAWFPSCYVYIVQNVVQPLLGNKADESVLEAQNPRFHQLASVLEAQLVKTKWILGDEGPSIVDVSVASPMHLHQAQKLPLDKYPNVKKWIAALEATPCWANTQGAVDKALLPGK